MPACLHRAASTWRALFPRRRRDGVDQPRASGVPTRDNVREEGVVSADHAEFAVHRDARPGWTSGRSMRPGRSHVMRSSRLLLGMTAALAVAIVFSDVTAA